MAETNRNLRGIDKAGQKAAWDRPLNPKQVSHPVPTKDNKPKSNWPKPARQPNGLQNLDNDVEN